MNKTHKVKNRLIIDNSYSPFRGLGGSFFIFLFFFSMFISAQKIKHPSLVFTPEKIQQAKQRIKSDTLFDGGWKEIKKVVDENLKKNDLTKCDFLALAYLMTDNKKYAEKVRDILVKTVRGATWSNNSEMLARKPVWHSDLQLAHKCNISALAYDAIYNMLTDAERKEIAAGLYKLGVEPSLGDWFLDPTRIHSLNSMGHNWWTSCVCNGGLLALSLQNELPQAREAANKLYDQLPEWFAFAGDELQNKPKTCDVAGGMYESVNYANFGISEAFLYRLSWQNAHPGEKQNEIPEIANAQNFFMQVCYPRTGILNSVNFGDSHKNITGENTVVLLDALGVKDKNMLWYLNQIEQRQTRDGYFASTPIGFLYWPDTKAVPKLPDLPQSKLFEDFGWATMRTSWEKDATMLAVKSGHTWNHSHADANSFIIFHNGVDIIKEAGNCFYPFPEYKDYFFQSRAHNVVLFNGEGQPTEQQYHGSMLDGHLSDLLDGGNIKYILANGTGPVAKNFIRNFRNFLWIDNVIYIMDDLKTYNTGKFEWLWHPSGEVKKNGFDLNVREGKSAVAIRPLYPECLAPSNFLHDYPDNMYVEEIQAPDEKDLKKKESYYSFHYPNELNSVKGLTAIILKDSANDKNLPQIEKIDGKNWMGIRVHNKGKVTDIIINQLADGKIMHSNSWIWAEGWETDAYMFAVSYPEGGKPENTSEVFVAYGSALRRGDVSYFASLSKASFISKNNGNRTELYISGQPLINVTLYSLIKPRQLTVNGKKADVSYQEKQLTIKIDNRK